MIKVQVKTIEMADKIEKFIHNYSKENPKVHHLRELFNKLEFGEHFIILMGDVELTFIQLRDMLLELESIKNNLNYKEQVI